MNKTLDGTLPQALYTYLRSLPEFPFKCEDCSQWLLPRQLVARGVLSEFQLQKMGVNAATLTFQKPLQPTPTSPPTQAESAAITTAAIVTTASTGDVFPPNTSDVPPVSAPHSHARSLPTTPHLPARGLGLPPTTTAAPAAPQDEITLLRHRLAQLESQQQRSSPGASFGLQPISSAPYYTPISSTLSGGLNPATGLAPQVSTVTPTTLQFSSTGPSGAAGATYFDYASQRRPSTYVSVAAQLPPRSSVPNFPSSFLGIGDFATSLGYSTVTSVPQSRAAAPSFSSALPNPFASSFTPTSGFGSALRSAPDAVGLPQPVRPVLPTLPQITLPEFRGETGKFPSWWATFECMVHNTQLSPQHKWELLKNTIKGKAKEKIEGVDDVFHNYDLALMILHRAYNRGNTKKKSLWEALDEIPPVNKSLTNLEKFTDTVRAKVLSLLSIGVPSVTLDEHTHILYRRLPPILQQEMKRQKSLRRTLDPSIPVEEQWSMEEFIYALEELQLIFEPSSKDTRSVHVSENEQETHNLVQVQQPPQKGNRTPKFSNNKDAASSEKGSNLRCIFCNGHNFSDSCKKVLRFADRRDIVAKKKLCFKCLREGHSARNCTRNKACCYCSGVSHHPAICKKQYDKSASNKEKSASEVKQTAKPKADNDGQPNADNSKQQRQCLSHRSDDTEEDSAEPPKLAGTVMATFEATVRHPHTGKTLPVNVYLDGGADSSSIRLQLSEQLNLPSLGEVLVSTATYGDSELKQIPASEVSFHLVSTNGSSFCLPMTALAVPTISADMKQHPVHLSSEVEELLQHYNVVNIPPQEDFLFRVDVLVGMDYFNHIMAPLDGKIIMLPGSMRINLTPFGSILSGASYQAKLASKQLRRIKKSLLCHTSRDISRIWSLESIGLEDVDNPVRLSPFQENFRESVHQLPDGRIEVRLPFVPNAKIGSNFKLAVKRLQSLIKHLCPDGKVSPILEKYNAQIQEWIDMDIVAPVGSEANGPIVHYLPHFAVIREHSATTKVRIVIDPTQKDPSGVCLNDLLFKGDSLMEDLTGLLLRFRTFEHVLVSDLEKAFLMIALEPSSQDACRFLWLKNPSNLSLDNNIQRYSFRRLAFGLICSPALLLFALQHFLEENPGPVADSLHGQIYMDNLCQHVQNEEEALELYRQTKDFFAKAKFNAREWQSDLENFQSQIPEKDRAKDTQQKMLGLVWNVQKDTLSLKPFKFEDGNTCSKRILLRTIATVFDPCGFWVPVTIRGRLLIQRQWKNGLDWDTPLSAEENKLWIQIQKDLVLLPSHSFKRKAIQAKSLTLCAFTDSSAQAMCVVIYAVQNGNTAFLFGKSRVAPLKPLLTIPRLELVGIVLGTRLLNYVEKQLRLPVVEKHLFSDSQIAVYQILSDKKLEPWVQRRVQEIRAVTSLHIHHINGDSNPADHGTRGMSFSNLLSSDWFTGPNWLCKPKSEWPEFSVSTSSTVAAVEATHMSVVRHHKVLTSSQSTLPFDLERFSSLFKLLKVTVFCLRFFFKLRKEHTSTGIPTSKELSAAQNRWILALQQTHFGETFQALRQQKKTSIAKQLDVFLDEEGFLRCGGRLANAPLTYGAKFPLLLPSHSDFTNLLIKQLHETNAHVGAKSTLSAIRQQFWIPHGLSTVQKVLRKCVPCRKAAGEAFQPPAMKDLPSVRLWESPAFTYTALDLMGPLMVRHPKSKETEKRWICLFTCLSTRALHLEVVFHCDTTSIIRALERFISRRGTPQVLLSDNQSSFLTSSKLLGQVWSDAQLDEEFQQFFSKNAIEWKFIPERSPWCNAVCERLVGLVKNCLRRTLWKSVLSDEALNTLVAKIEAVLNSRPLLSVGSEIADSYLSPSCFLAPSSQLVLPPIDVNLSDPDYSPEQHGQDLLQLYKKGQAKLQDFWKLFSTQYLQELRERNTLQFPARKGELLRQPQIGELCLIREPSSRLRWPLARIEEFLPSSDGQLRFVVVRLPSGHTTRRGIKELIPLELSPESNEETRTVEQIPVPQTIETAPDGQIETPQREQSLQDSTSAELPKQTRSGRQYFSSTVRIPFFLTTFFCLCFLPLSSSVSTASPSPAPQFQICYTGPGGKKLVLPEEIACRFDEHSDHKNVSLTLYIPERKLPRSEAFLCFLETVSVCATEGFFPGPAVVHPEKVTRAKVAPAECKAAAKSKMYNTTTLIRDTVLAHAFSTGHTVQVKSRWWNTVCSQVTNFVLIEGDVESQDGSTIQTSLIDAHNCNLLNGSCLLEEATLIWSLRTLVGYCPFSRKGIYNGLYDTVNKLITIPQLQAAFHLITFRRGFNINSCIPPQAYSTKEGPVIFFGRHAGRKRRFAKAEQNDSISTAQSPTSLQKMEQFLRAVNISAEDYDPVDSKLNYLVEENRRQFEFQSRQRHYAFCRFNQYWLKFLKSLLRIDETEGARLALDRSDIVAEIRDGEIFIHKCYSIQHSAIYSDFRHPQTGRCHQFLPVRVGERIWFQSPGSQDLVPHSPEIPCDRVVPNPGQSNIRDAKDTVLAMLPHFLHEVDLDFPVFSSPPLFKARVPYTPVLLRAFSSSVAVLDNRLKVVINYTANSSPNPAAVREILVGAGEMGSQWVHSVFDSVGDLFSTSVDSVSDFSSHFFSPIIHVLQWAFSLFVLVCLVGFAICLFCRYCQKIKKDKANKSDYDRSFPDVE